MRRVRIVMELKIGEGNEDGRHRPGQPGNRSKVVYATAWAPWVEIRSDFDDGLYTSR